MISPEWMPLLNECLAIAYQTVEDEETAKVITLLMQHLEQAEMSSLGIGAARVVPGSYESTELH